MTWPLLNGCVVDVWLMDVFLSGNISDRCKLFDICLINKEIINHSSIDFVFYFA